MTTPWTSPLIYQVHSSGQRSIRARRSFVSPPAAVSEVPVIHWERRLRPRDETDLDWKGRRTSCDEMTASATRNGSPALMTDRNARS